MSLEKGTKNKWIFKFTDPLNIDVSYYKIKKKITLDGSRKI
jgi:hypothetical protein